MEGITNTFTVSGSKGASARVTVTEEYDIAANASVLKVAVAVACANYYGHTYYINGTISAAGKTLQTMRSSAGSHRVTIDKKNTYYSIKGSGAAGSPWTTAALTHNNDGTLTVTVAVDFKGYEPNGNGANGFTISGSRSVTLTQIPRASGVQATDAAIGSASLITVSRKSADYVHSLAWSFGSRGGYLAADGTMTDTEETFTATGVPFAIPEDFYSQIPNAPSGPCTLTCTTYLGDTRVGDPQSCVFTVTADPALCGPLLQAVVTDINENTAALTGDTGILVANVSHARCALTATSRFGAEITQKTVNGENAEDTVTLPVSANYLFAATDSRGYTAACTVTPLVVPYVPLSCRATAKRDDPTSGRVTLTVSGECYNGTFGAAENALSLRCRVGTGDWLTLTPVFQDHTYTATAALTGLDYDRRHTVTVEAADLLTQTQTAATVDKGIPVFHWGEEDFVFQVPVQALGGICGADGRGFTPLGDAVPPRRTVCGHPLTGDITLTPTDIGALPFTESTEYPGCYCRALGEETEWLNPPMLEGEEYRTTERYLGNPVYVKRIDCGALSNSDTKNVAHGITGTVIGFEGFATNANGLVQTMPVVSVSLSVTVKMHVTAANVVVVTGTGVSTYSAAAVIRYIK